MPRAVLPESVSTDFLSPRWKRHSMTVTVAASERTPPITLLYWLNEKPSHWRNPLATFLSPWPRLVVPSILFIFFCHRSFEHRHAHIKVDSASLSSNFPFDFEWPWQPGPLDVFLTLDPWLKRDRYVSTFVSLLLGLFLQLWANITKEHISFMFYMRP